MPSPDLRRLEHELRSPRLSALRSTLGLAVPLAALSSCARGSSTGTHPRATVHHPARGDAPAAAGA